MIQWGLAMTQWDVQNQRNRGIVKIEESMFRHENYPYVVEFQFGQTYRCLSCYFTSAIIC